ncbi:6258_t:CDS:10 [Paraglomus occultum]|uniref:6258_t:CDS:1 n=1 Tax=Paraglomus occultum TaxID=144539 RepID=A0A9N9G4X6_9GLOM|nr:6258_t:CDS:10 [Paraglomus occultum]
MGAADSKLAFRKGVFRLFEERNIPADDEYWLQFWELPDTADDVFSLIGASDIRRVRDKARENLETLIRKLIARMIEIVRAPDFPSPQNSTLQLLNCIRVLTRLMPFIYEDKNLDEWEERLFWSTPVDVKDARKNISEAESERTSNDASSIKTTATITITAATPSPTTDQTFSNRASSPPAEPAKSLGELLLSTIVEILFMSGFTIPTISGNNSRINYVIWETGVGSNMPIGSSKELDSNKTEALRLLLSLFSKSMYMGGATYMTKENKFINHMVLKMERKIVLALLCSLLNTAIKYNPTGWGIPYNHMVFVDGREMLVTFCLQVLLVLQDYRSVEQRANANVEARRMLYRNARPNDEQNNGNNVTRSPSSLISQISTATKNEATEQQNAVETAGATKVDTPNEQKKHLSANIDNAFRHYTSKLHRNQDFQFLMDGIYRILSNPMQANNTYLPGSTKQVRCHLEMLMLFWKLLEINKRFRAYLLETDRVLDMLIVLLYYALENKNDEGQAGLVRMCAFILQAISSEREFGIRLNKSFERHGSLPGNVRIPAFHGTYADFMIISIQALITTTHGSLSLIYPALIITISNVSPYLKNLSVLSSNKLVQLFSSFTTPSFLLAEEGNHLLAAYTLETFNNIIQYQFSDNPNLVYAMVRNHRKFEDFSKFTLSKGLSDIKKLQLAREERRRQIQPTTPKSPTSPKRPASTSASHRNKISSQEEITEQTELLHPERNSDDTERKVSETGDVNEGEMSEKARGKLPEGASPPERGQTGERSTERETVAENDKKNLEKDEKTERKMERIDGKVEGRTDKKADLVITPFAVGKSGFIPTEDWVSSWHSNLPIGNILILLTDLVPKVQQYCLTKSLISDYEVLDFLRKITLVGILPPPQPIYTRRFQWTEASVVWFSSVLWGQVYIAANSYLGVYNGTYVSLFSVKSDVKEESKKDVGKSKRHIMNKLKYTFLLKPMIVQA